MDEPNGDRSAPSTGGRLSALAAPRPATSGRRITWEQVPPEVRAGINRLLNDEVVTAQSQPGGFSEGLAARVRLAGGGRAFVKAVSREVAPAVAWYHRQEIAVTRQLPARAPVPRLLGAEDDGTWVCLVFEDAEGRLPSQPWRRDELERVLTAVTELADVLDPSPIDPSALRPPRLGGWRELAGGGEVDRLRVLSPWAVEHLEELAALEDGAWPAVAGRSLQHGDLYPFNILLSRERVVAVDWPHAWAGAAHCDVLTLLSTISNGGLDPQEHLATHPLTRGLEPEQVDLFLVLHSGFLFRLASTLGPEADPTMVAMVRSLGQASLRWLRRRREAS